MGVNGIYGLSGSGLDVESMVKVGMLSKQSEYEKMQQKYTVDEWKKTEYLSLYKEVQTFNASTLSKYKMSSNMNSRSAESADTSSVKATANANAATMTHYVEVQGLASSAYLIGTNSPTRLNTAADQKTQLSSVLFDSIAENSSNTDTVTISVTNSDGTTTNSTTQKDAIAFSFSINDGVNGLMASDNSDVVVASASPDAAKGEYTVKVDTVAKAAVSKGASRATAGATVLDVLKQSPITTAVQSYTTQTDTALTFNFWDGTKTAGISVTYADLNGTVDDFLKTINAQFKKEGLTLNAGVSDNNEISIENTNIGYDINLSVSYVDSTLKNLKKDDGAGYIGYITSALFAEGKFNSYSYSTTTSIATGTDATGVEVTDENGTSISYTVKGNTITAGGMTITAKAATTGMKITNDQSQVVSVTYGQLLEGFSFYDLTSQVNSMGLNVRLNYDSVQDRFSLYNKKSGENNQINIQLGTGDGSANAAKFFNQLGLKQSSNGEIVNEALSFAQGTTVTQAGVNASAKVDGIEYKNLDSNNLTVDGVTYNFQNITTEGKKVPVTVTQDTESIVKNVQSFVDDYNALLTKLYKWYDEKPNSDYKPLTETQKSGMKEEQIEKWEEKAKAGMLYHDKTLGNIITELRSAVSGNVEGISGKYTNIFSIGISTTGLKGQLTLDKDKLNAALADDPDAVYNVFAKLDANDEFDSNGVAQRLGDVFQSAMKSVKSVAGTTADITEDSELNNLMRELQTKMSNFKKMMQAFETRLYKKYDAMESSLALLGSQLNYVTSAFQ